MPARVVEPDQTAGQVDESDSVFAADLHRSGRLKFIRADVHRATRDARIAIQVGASGRERIPAVTHFDHTSRYQSVTPQSNEKYHKLISRFEEKTGIPVVLNTSFNGPEEPIVETPTDAINTMLKHDLYALFINNYVIMKKK